MDIFSVLHQVVSDIMHVLWPDTATCDINFTVEPPNDPCHGDVATNAPLILARYLKQSPKDIGMLLLDKLAQHAWVEHVELAGAGFLNMRLTKDAWHSAIQDLLDQKSHYGCRPPGSEPMVNVEYVSANPTGPLHVGHARGAILGDTLARVLEAVGHLVVKEYYINDAGRQADQLGQSVYRRYREALGVPNETHMSNAYPGEYLIPVGCHIAERYGAAYVGAAESEWLPVMREEGIKAMLALIRQDVQVLGLAYDVWTSERSLEEKGCVDEVIARLDQAGYIYQGVLEPPKGKVVDDWEPRPQMLFRSTAFGDDCDRPLKKSDGQWTYFARDIAYHYDKWKRGAAQQVSVLGADHGGYVKRMQAALAVLTEHKAHLDVKICHIVTFMQDGQPLKMSKRAGTFASVQDLVHQVGVDVVRFTMLSRKEGAPLVCDLARMVQQTKDNPVFYIQYAYARIHSVERQALQLVPQIFDGPQDLKKADLGLLSREEEWAILKYLMQWPRVLNMTASSHEPHRITFYLLHLATLFHNLWNQGKEQSVLRFIQTDHVELTLARLTLNRMVVWVLGHGMGLLGITLRKEM